MVITTGSAPAALGGGMDERMRMGLGDPVGKKHKVRLLHGDGPRAGKTGTMTVIAPSREAAEGIAAKSWPQSKVISQFAHKQVDGSEG